jgi:DNA-binding transcriptional MerR regulator
MSERIFTLFGEEIQPEQLKAVGKSRAKKKTEEQEPVAKPKPEIAEEPVAIPEPIVATGPETSEAPAENKFEIPEDWKGDKKYYSIGEVAALFKVKTSHIRFWTNEFKLKVRTTRKGDRLYTAEQVRELRAINHLVKERGFKLSGAKAKLKAQNNKDVETIDLKQSLLQLRNKLVIIKNQLG